MSIGKRITAARERRRWTKSELARQSAITPAAIWQIENGQREPSSATLRKLVLALDVSADMLLDTERPCPTCEAVKRLLEENR